MRASFLEQALENVEDKQEVKKELFDYFLYGLNNAMTEPERTAFLKIVEKIEEATLWNSSSTSLGRFASQNCSQMMILTTWKKTTYQFINVKHMQEATDFGLCCRLYPQINFDDPDKDTKTDEELYVNKKPGVKNGLVNGLTVLLDVETVEYSSKKSSTGFMVALSDAAGRAMISQQGRSKFVKQQDNCT